MKRHLPHVRPPRSPETRAPDWRPLDPTRAGYFSRTDDADHATWNSVKNGPRHCFYY